VSEDTNQEILAELRKLTQINQRAYYLLIVIVIAVAATIFFEKKTHQQDPWKNVNLAWDQQDYSEALSLAQNILSKDTNNAWGHEYLGNIYFRMGDITNAEAAYKQAYQLYPSKTYEDNIQTIEKRIAMEHSEQSQSK
jgi:cytochrome c-type biogenesis protein CcmH/NrfG